MPRKPYVWNGQETIDIADAYLDAFELGRGNGMGEQFPTRQGMVLKLGCTQKTLDNWRDQYNGKDGALDFDAVCDRLDALRTLFCANDGAIGRLDSAICRTIMSNGGKEYITRKQVDNVSTDGSMTPATFTIAPASLKND